MDRKLAVGIFLVMIVLVCGIIGAIIMRINAPKQEMGESFVVQFVSGTEYNIGEEGQVIVEARYSNGTSAFSTACLISIWYPDKSTFLLENASSGANGNQYIVFTVPNVTGVYEYQAECSGIGVVSKSFHVSAFQNETTQKLLRHIKAVVEG
jgi:hypothetical protein